MPKKPSILKLGIYIPTYNRVGPNYQQTVRNLNNLTSITPTLICPFNEVRHHEKDTFKARVIGCPAKGIGPTRQWILEKAPEEIVVMIDDDMCFFERKNRKDYTDYKLDSITSDFNQLFKLIIRLCEYGFVHGGVGPRHGNNRKIPSKESTRGGVVWLDELIQFNARSNNFHFFKPKIFLENTRFDKLEVMEDFYVTLDLLTKGFPNAIIHSWVWNQPTSNMEGGCSSYRSEEVQEASANKLHEYFPDYVSVVKKKSTWKNMPERTDVRLACHKAWKNNAHKNPKMKTLLEKIEKC